MKARVPALAAALLLALGAAESAKAQPAPAPTQTATDALAAEAQVWLGQVMTWIQPFNDAFGRETEMLGSLNEGVGAAYEHYENGDRKKGRAWASAWTAATRKEIAALGARITALPTAPPAPPSAVANDPRIAKMLTSLGDMPKRLADYHRRAETVSVEVIDLAARTAGGNDKAAGKLGGSVFNLNIVVLESEIELLRSGRAMLTTAAHPQESLTDASIAANLAMIAILEGERDLVLGEPVDEAALAARLRQHAAQMDAAAGQIKTRAERTLADTRKVPEIANTPLFKAIAQAMASYEESAKVEVAIADGLREIAASIDDQEALDFDTIAAQTEALVPLFEKRAALDQARKNLFAAL